MSGVLELAQKVRQGDAELEDQQVYQFWVGSMWQEQSAKTDCQLAGATTIFKSMPERRWGKGSKRAED